MKKSTRVITFETAIEKSSIYDTTIAKSVDSKKSKNYPMSSKEKNQRKNERLILAVEYLERNP